MPIKLPVFDEKVLIIDPDEFEKAAWTWNGMNDGMGETKDENVHQVIFPDALRLQLLFESKALK